MIRSYKNVNYIRFIYSNACTVIGWSVTVAGNCCTEMAPDVEMRLSFPNQIKYESFRGVKQYTAAAVTGTQDDHDYYMDDYNQLSNPLQSQQYQFGRRLDHHQMAHNRQSLPTPAANAGGGMMMMLGTGNENPRRSLMKINGKKICDFNSRILNRF